MNTLLGDWLSRLTYLVRSAGPYVAIALIPGGLILLSLWALRHRIWLATNAPGLVASALPVGLRARLRTERSSSGRRV